MAMGTMEKLQYCVSKMMDRPIWMYRVNNTWMAETEKCDVGATVDNETKLKRWEYKLTVEKYLDSIITYKEGTKMWTENKGNWYYLVLQHCPPELKTQIKNLAC